MKSVLIINAHPLKKSFSSELATVYSQGAESAGAKVKIINIIDLTFDPILKSGFKKATELEPDIVEAQRKIKEADHLVFIYPNWWGTYPALLKGFIDRAFLPNFAFRYINDKPLPEKLLTGKSARIIVTMDTPMWYYRLVYRSPGDNSLKKSILEFCGIKPVRFTHFTPMRKANEQQLKIWLDETKSLGAKLI